MRMLELSEPLDPLELLLGTLPEPWPWLVLLL